MEALPIQRRSRRLGGALRLAALAALVALRSAAGRAAAFAGLLGRGPTASGLRLAATRPRPPHWLRLRFGLAPPTARWAGGPNRQRLEEEATAVDSFFRSVTDFFSPKPQEPTPEELEAAERRKEASLATEKALRPLKLSVLAGIDEEGAPLRRAAPIAVLQSQAKQSLAIFAATEEQALTDILLSLRISAREFAERNLLVVPVLVSLETKTLMELSPKIRASKLLNQGPVALPVAASEEDSSEWGTMFAREFFEAEDQGMGEQAEAQGLALLVRSSGEIVRRGVGRPDWQAVFSDLGL